MNKTIDIDGSIRKILSEFKVNIKNINIINYRNRNIQVNSSYVVLKNYCHFSTELWVEKYKYEKNKDIWLGVRFSELGTLREYRRKLKEVGIIISPSGNRVPTNPNKLYIDSINNQYWVGYYKLFQDNPAFSANTLVRNFSIFIKRLEKVQDNLLEEQGVLDTEIIKTGIARRNQQKFANNVSAIWNKTCPISKIAIPGMLVASHIDPWANSKKDRLNEFNGIYLSANIDKLFDRYLISFDKNGKLCISKSISRNQRKIIGLREGIKISFNNKHLKFLKVHKNIFDRKETC